MVHTPITGYRELSHEELAKINEIKEVAIEVGKLVDDLRNLADIDQRWAALGKTHLQQGFMALIRAVAKPETF